MSKQPSEPPLRSVKDRDLWRHRQYSPARRNGLLRAVNKRQSTTAFSDLGIPMFPFSARYVLLYQSFRMKTTHVHFGVPSGESGLSKANFASKSVMAPIAAGFVWGLG